MPYTPPAQSSPESSKVSSPLLSRSSSYGASTPLKVVGSSPTSRGQLPRSASYLTKHRRTPSVAKSNQSSAAEPDYPLQDRVTNHSSHDAPVFRPSSSLRQSPPPLIDTNIMPVGAVMSPPDSGGNSSDDEDSLLQRKGRRLENLDELKAAIRSINQRREGSPDREHFPDYNLAVNTSLPSDSSDERRELNASPQSWRAVSAPHPPPLSPEARKLSHSRSSTEASFLDVRKEEVSLTSSEDENEALVMARRTPMVRKKSGELVKPALKPGFSRARPSSMPSTPTYPKNVHFSSHLEHVRHFLQVDKPLAVSAGSSPVEMYDSETEFPFEARPTTPPFEWEIVLPNFPAEGAPRQSQMVRVEKVFLSPDNKNLVGTVAVANISFQKWVVVRFTLDYWKTVSEVTADYNADVRRKHLQDGFDRFNFSIKLSDMTKLETKTLFFCVRYSVNGQEHWDSNKAMNFQVEFRKKALPQNGKKGMQGAKSRPLPHSRPQSSSASRPRSMPPSFDDFADGFDTKYDFGVFRPHPLSTVESPGSLRLKTQSFPQESERRSTPINAAFGNRYDFGASLSAAISAANSVLGERSGIKMKADNVEPKTVPPGVPVKSPARSQSWFGDNITASPVAVKPADVPGLSRPDALVSEKPSFTSTTYNELLDKYCFFGSGKNSPLPHGSPLVDGAADKVLSSNVQREQPASREFPFDKPSRSDSPRLNRSGSPSPNISPAVSQLGYPYHHHVSAFAFGDHTTVVPLST